MKGTRWTLTLLMVLLLAPECPAQFSGPAPIFGAPVIAPGGIDFWFSSRRLRIAGFIPTGSPFVGVTYVVGQPIAPYYFGFYPAYAVPVYGVSNTRISLQVTTPPTIIQTRRSLAPYTLDVAGIDLDDEPPSTIWGKKAGERVAAARIPPDRVKPAQVPAPPAPEVQGKDLAPAWRQRTDDGLAAFRNGEFGVAALRFRQAVEADALATAQAPFLQGQALIAVGKYLEAVQVLQQALKRRPDWPVAPFRPRADLYGNDENWNVHNARLLQASLQEPDNADYHFLLGYLAWFDGQKDKAIACFQRSRALTADTQWADLFLQVAKK